MVMKNDYIVDNKLYLLLLCSLKNIFQKFDFLNFNFET